MPLRKYFRLSDLLWLAYRLPRRLYIRFMPLRAVIRLANLQGRLRWRNSHQRRLALEHLQIGPVLRPTPPGGNEPERPVPGSEPAHLDHDVPEPGVPARRLPPRSIRERVRDRRLARGPHGHQGEQRENE